MPKEETDRPISHEIKVWDLELTIVTRRNGSQINMSQYMYSDLPGHGTFWIDLQFEIESVLHVKVINMDFKLSDFRRPLNKDILHIIHTPLTQS
jgi:hypothetical protein